MARTPPLPPVLPKHPTYYTVGLCAGLPHPQLPRSEIERVLGRVHIETYNEREAEREYDALIRGEAYRYVTPETDADGYLVFSHPAVKG